MRIFLIFLHLGMIDKIDFLCKYVASTLNTGKGSIMNKHGLNKPIGVLGSVEGWKSQPITECGERLVPLGAFSDYPQIATDAIYVGERNSSPYGCLKLAGSMFAVFAREGVAKMLAKASALLPRAHMLLVWDAYRPLAVQQALFDSYVSELEGRGMAHEQALVDAQRFVSIPTTDQTKPPPHNTGGSVDLTIIRFNETDWREMERLAKASRAFDRAGDWEGVYASEMCRQQLIREASTPLAMGTPFDGVQPETATRFYEDADITSLDDVSRQRLLNRRLLWNAMTRAGFSNYPDEWWHYDFGNQFDAARTGRKAIYGAISPSTENEAWEKMRRGHYLGNISIAERQSPPRLVSKLGADTLYPFVRDLVQRTGNMGYTTHPQAAGF
jgi:zinc D-Ala-D-Ala dipeptidase